MFLGGDAHLHAKQRGKCGRNSTLVLTATVAVTAPTAVTNTVTISGGDEFNMANNTAGDLTPITQAADLTITKTHAGNFTAGVNGIYTITVSNVGPGPTVGTVTLDRYFAARFDAFRDQCSGLDLCGDGHYARRSVECRGQL